MSEQVGAPSKQKEVKSTLDNKKKPEVSLDFSFMEIDDPAELENLEPRPGTGKKITRKDDEKYNAKCLRLNNNKLQDLKGLTDIVIKVIEQPNAITWIDLSFNDISVIDPAFCDYTSLQILYLHGNKIEAMTEVDKLAGLPALKKLSLHGNAVENTKNYRWYVLTRFPGLNSLDMSPVTKSDRANAETFKKSPQHKKKKKSDNS